MITPAPEPHNAAQESFDEVVLGADVPVLVEFWATWRPPCRLLGPILADVAAERAGRLRVVKVDGDTAFGLTERFRVLGFPTMILFRRGEPLRSMVGAMPKARLLAEVDAALDGQAARHRDTGSCSSVTHWSRGPSQSRYSSRL